MAQKYWFAAKRYGWGWGLPRTWQGWVVYISYLIIVVLDILFSRPSSQAHNYVPFLSIIFLATLLLLFICLKKGEKPKWRWGKK